MKSATQSFLPDAKQTDLKFSVRQRITNNILLLILIATSANPYFFDSNEFLILGFVFSAFIFFMRNKSLDLNYFKVAFLFLCIEALQTLTFGSFDTLTFLSLFIKLTFAYFVVRCLEGLFYDYFIRINYVICVISLLFYGISYVPGVYDFLYYNVTPIFDPPFYKSEDFYLPQKNVIIYTFAYDCYLTFRNPGPFWEPGIFAIFIILALVFNIIRENSIKTKTSLVFIITILTTISTAGYLALFLLLFFYFLSSTRVKFKLFYIAAVLVLALYLYSNLSFMSEKLTQNMEMTEHTGSRFGSLVADWELFKESPWIGWGRGSMRFGGASQAVFTQDLHRNNGLAALITQYGIILSLIYFYLYYVTFRAYCWLNDHTKYFAILGFMVILFISFSQIIYTRQFFLSLLFAGIHIRKINGNFMANA